VCDIPALEDYQDLLQFLRYLQGEAESTGAPRLYTNVVSKYGAADTEKEPGMWFVECLIPQLEEAVTLLVHNKTTQWIEKTQKEAQQWPTTTE